MVTLTLVGTVWSAEPCTISNAEGCDISLSRWSRLFCRLISNGIVPSTRPAYFGMNRGCVMACCCLSSGCAISCLIQRVAELNRLPHLYLQHTMPNGASAFVGRFVASCTVFIWDMLSWSMYLF